MVPHLLRLSSSLGSRNSSLQLQLKVLLFLPHVLQLTAQILYLSLVLLQPETGEGNVGEWPLYCSEQRELTGSVHHPQPQRAAL